MKDLTTNHVLGETIAHFRVIEFQKRGLPHAHILLTLDPNCRPRRPRDYDQIVSAEIPNPELHPAAYETVTHLMMHGPCGEAFPEAPCMVNGRCSKGYPRKFIEETTDAISGYPSYRRPNNGRRYRISASVSLDNRWVVPHNVVLCTKYNAHINVEICSSIHAVKYLYKYVYKGHDRALISLRRNIREQHEQQQQQQQQAVVFNEIQQYTDTRYVSASEALWRLYSFSLFHRSPAVQLLLLHLPNQQAVYYNENEDLQTIAQRTVDRPTTLLAFFDLNR